MYVDSEELAFESSVEAVQEHQRNAEVEELLEGALEDSISVSDSGWSPIADEWSPAS